MFFLSYLLEVLWSLFIYTFVFALGGATFIFIAAYIILSRVTGALTEAQNEHVDSSMKVLAQLPQVLLDKEARDILAEETSISQQTTNNTGATSPRNERHSQIIPTINSPPEENHPGKYTPKAWFKLLSKPPTDFTEKQKEGKIESDYKAWNWAVLRNNMLFQFVDDKASACIRPVCLDGCQIAMGQLKKNGRPLWRNTNWIVLSHPTRDIITDHKSVYLVFKQAKDLEEWYLLFGKATRMGEPRSEAEKHQAEFWGRMSERLTNHATDSNPHWLTAVFCRILWRIHDSKGFQEFLTEKFEKKTEQDREAFHSETH